MEMTSRQRVLAAFAHESVDRTPVFEYVLLSPVADALLRRPFAPSRWPEALEELGFAAAVRQLAVDQLDLAVLLGHDMMFVCPNPPASAPPAPPAAGPAPPDDDPVARLRARNEAAEAAPPAPQETFLIYEVLREQMRRREVDLPVLAPAYTLGIWTDTDLMMTIALAPEVARRHFQLARRRALELVEQYVRLGVDLVGVGGDFAGNRLLISPDSYRRLIVPEVAAVSRRLHQAGRLAVNASDGMLWDVLDDFLIGCEVDGYLEIDAHAGMDLRRLKRQYGRRVTFLGNLDCGNVLSFASPEQVRRHVIQCIEDGSEQDGAGNTIRSGHVLCASNAITASVPLANYLAAVNAYREVFHLPRFAPE